MQHRKEELLKYAFRQLNSQPINQALINKSYSPQTNVNRASGIRKVEIL
jgi:hypothetical protein